MANVQNSSYIVYLYFTGILTSALRVQFFDPNVSDSPVYYFASSPTSYPELGDGGSEPVL